MEVTECDKKLMEDFLKNVKLIIKEIRGFNDKFTECLENQKKQSKELLMLVIRYNVLNKWVLILTLTTQVYRAS